MRSMRLEQQAHGQQTQTRTCACAFPHPNTRTAVAGVGIAQCIAQSGSVRPGQRRGLPARIRHLHGQLVEAAGLQDVCCGVGCGLATEGRLAAEVYAAVDGAIRQHGARLLTLANRQKVCGQEEEEKEAEAQRGARRTFPRIVVAFLCISHLYTAARTM